jgi:hypothetical protein
VGKIGELFERTIEFGESVMGLSAREFRDLARDCIREAELSKDDERKQTLLEIARLYNQRALQIEFGDAPTAKRSAA